MGALASVGAVVPSMLALQAAQALLMAGVLWVFQRRFGYPVVAYWTYGWLALALLVAVATVADSLDPTSTSLAFTALSALALLCEYLKVVCLLLGAFAVADHAGVQERSVRGFAIASVIVAIAAVVPFADTPGATFPRFVLRVGVAALLTGTAQLLAGVVLWSRAVPRVVPRVGAPALGQRLVGTAFVALGTLALVTFARELLAAAPRGGAPLVVSEVGAQLLLHFALGLGLVIWLLEGEQRRTLDAAQRAEHLAYHDALTGLPNRMLLTDRLRLLTAQARRTRQPFAVFFLDVDHFKDVNDSLGHAAGDRLLQQLGARLTAQLREADTVARLGGDEFVVLTPDLRSTDDVAAVAEKLREAARAPIVIDDREVRVTVSIGASVFPDDADDADALLRRSDAALYDAKQSGRDTVRLVQRF